MLEAEQTCIGAICHGGEQQDAVMELLKPEYFLDEQCREYCKAAFQLRQTGKAIDEISIASEIASPGDHVETLLHLRGFAPTVAGAKVHTSIVRDSWVKHRLREISLDIAQLSKEPIATEDMVHEATSMLGKLADNSAQLGFQHMATASKSFIQEITQNAINGTQVTGLKTGFSVLDAMTGGLQKGDLIILGGRPSHAKTATSMAIANHVALNHTVLIFSAEMAIKQLAMRSVSMFSQIDFDRIRQGQITEVDAEALKNAQDHHERRNLYVDDRSGISIGQIASRAKAQARKTGCDLIVVDYLTLVSGSKENRVHEISEVSAGLKTLAKDMNVPVIAIAQLSRKCDERADKRPVPSDLRDSGTIEQDADVIAFCYLDEKYHPKSARAGILELLIRKQRQGATGSVFLDFNGAKQTITQRHAPVPELSVSKSRKGYDEL